MQRITLILGLFCGTWFFNSGNFSQLQDGQTDDGDRTIRSERPSWQDGPNQENVQEIRTPRTSPKSAVTEEGPVKWPMRMAKGRPVPVIEANVNGQGPFLFYLDTGAATTTLNRAFVEKLNLPIDGKTNIRGPGTGPGMEADIVTIDRLQIGDVDIRDFEAAAFDRAEFAGGEDLAGSIGLPVFGELPFTMDYHGNQITLGGDGLPEVDGKTVLACDFSGPVPVFDIQLGDATISAAFDSGFAGLLLVGEKSAKKLTLLSEPKTIGKGRSVSGEIDIKGAPIDGSLKVGDHTTANPMLVIMPAILTDREICVLGHAWGKEMSVTYDMKNKRVRFLKSDTVDKDRNSESHEEYAGQYGARTVFQEEGKLKYRREGGPAIELKPIGDDTFELVIPAGARTAVPLPNVRFERDDQKRIKGLSLVRENEVEEYVEKSGG